MPATSSVLDLTETCISHRLPEDTLKELALPALTAKPAEGPFRFGDDHLLVVIDMEEGAARGRYHNNYLNQRWWERHRQVVNNILKVGSQFSNIIFVVDASFYNRNNLKILAELRPLAARARLVFKKKNDGSDAMESLLIPGQVIYGCGMNTCACVTDTLKGLRELGFASKVIGDACWDVYSGRLAQFGKVHTDALSRLRRRHAISSVMTAELCAQ